MSQFTRTVATTGKRALSLSSPQCIRVHARSPSSSSGSQQQHSPLIPRSPSQAQYPSFSTPQRSPSQAVFANQQLPQMSMMLQVQQSLSDFSFDCVPENKSRRNASRKPVAVEKKKRLPNSFIHYRKTFGDLYPAIDRAIPTQKDRSSVTGACWRRESPSVRARCEIAVQMQERTFEEAVKLENIKVNMREKRMAKRLAEGKAELEGRNLMLVNEWASGKTDEEIARAIAEYDAKHGFSMGDEPARKKQRTKGKRNGPLAPPSAPSSMSPASSMSSLPVSPAPPSSLSLSPGGLYSPATSVTSLPSQDFAPQVSFDAESASARWQGLVQRSEEPFVPLMTFEDQPAIVPAYMSDLVNTMALFPPLSLQDQPNTFVSAPMSDIDMQTQIADAGFVLPGTSGTEPLVLGGLDNLQTMYVQYSFPEHYGAPPTDTFSTEVDNFGFLNF